MFLELFNSGMKHMVDAKRKIVEERWVSDPEPITADDLKSFKDCPEVFEYTADSNADKKESNIDVTGDDVPINIGIASKRKLWKCPECGKEQHDSNVYCITSGCSGTAPEMPSNF